MSFKTQEIIWSVPLEDVQIGTAIGYEIEFSQSPYFNSILYSITTYDEVTASPAGTFYYSLNGGTTWINFPIGNAGQVFDTAYQMKLVINVGESGRIFCEKGGTIYAVSGDGKEVLDQYEIGSFTSSGFEIDSQNNLYVSGQDKTAYKIETISDLEPGNSLNLHADPLAISIDGSRYFLWQVERKNLYLKDLDYRTIFNIALPFEIDVDYSSSSSSSSSVSSSSISSESSSSVSSSSISSNSS